MKLNIFNETEHEPPSSGLNTLFERLIKGEAADKWPSQVNLIFIDDQRMQELNGQYRDIDRTTDVLSFNIDEPSDPEGVLGEIYISVPVAIDQAKEYQTTLEDEIRRLFTHGLLHLFGYDHKQVEEAERMFSTEEKYLGLTREEE